MNIKRLIINLVLLVAVGVLTYMVYDSIMQPVRFQKVRAQREEVIKKRLGEIKTLQVEYKKIYNRYAGNFDTLIMFYETDSMPLVLKHGTAPDTLTEEQALEMHLITRDTSMIAIKDTLFKDMPDFNIENIQYVPFTHKKVKFKMQTGFVTRANFQIPVMQVSCEMKDYLADIKQQDLLQNEINLIKEDEKFPGLVLGSMDEPTTDGNW